jgi:uncharacterized membrane protein
MTSLLTIIILALIINSYTLFRGISKGQFAHGGTKSDPRMAYAKRSRDPIAYGFLLILHLIATIAGLWLLISWLFGLKPYFITPADQFLFAIGVAVGAYDLYFVYCFLGLFSLLNKNHPMREEEKDIESMKESLVVWVIVLLAILIGASLGGALGPRVLGEYTK